MASHVCFQQTMQTIIPPVAWNTTNVMSYNSGSAFACLLEFDESFVGIFIEIVGAATWLSLSDCYIIIIIIIINVVYSR